MNTQQTPRQLLLEQLESRCLLAGSVFLFSSPAPEASAPRNDSINRHPADVQDRGGLAREQGQERRQVHRQEQTKQSVVTVIVFVPTTSNGNDLIPPQTQPNVPTLPSRSTPEAEVVTAMKIPSESQQQTDVLAEQPTASSIDQQFASPETVARLGSSLPIASAETSSIDLKSSGARDRWENDVANEPMTLERHVIDTFPMLHHQLLESKPTETEPPWELHRETLKRLREVTQEPLNHRPESTDAVIASWFDGAGGLVDLSDHATSRLQPAEVDRIVTVGLDARFGLHRSFDLIASAETEPVSDDVRVAILDMLRRVSSDEAPPISENTPTRIPSLTYSGAALAAVGVALTVRRKRSASSAAN
ncbi:hypothetical protein [Novipirellula artificiosorum]|uniref:Uncharacterized protein n=1 Tax=Novipirellula artificiosorum TaxID=2528016 RepID=A0A5C6D4K9_9BACT|nr:hypothetical protein [Novipirellula artificiosorum]TWU30854.1 hypothetical protein Poly41_65480 [Novipirellula artificiosorum]